MVDGFIINIWAVVIIIGVDYWKFFVEGVVDFIGVGIYYGVVMIEVNVCWEKEVYIVGGGNFVG